MSSSTPQIDHDDLANYLVEEGVIDSVPGEGHPVAANASNYSPEEVERIQKLIQDTSETVAKFRQLVDAQNDDEAQGINFDGDTVERGSKAGKYIKQALEQDADRLSLPRKGVLWGALKTKDTTTDDGSVQVPPPSKAELLARREDSKRDEPHIPPLSSGQESHVPGDETLPDFFTLRLSLRYLQYRHKSGTEYTDDIKNEYTLLLDALSETSVQYNAMHRSTRHHREATEKLNQVRDELKEARLDYEEQAKIANDFRTELDSVREELLEQKKEADATKLEMKKLEDEKSRLIAEVNAEKASLARESKQQSDALAALAAETSVLRKALADACDTIADDLSQRLLTEAVIQDLEDRLAEQSRGARELKKYAD